ncbi:restriction endonuclease subunit S [Clostridium perfringens]|uniref:restriction endonuclease subunit S n=1 Tax=Clostridium perfringens TaxID=1502 RepID=UPI003B016B8B
MNSDSNYDYLKITKYSKLENWSFKYLNKNNINFNSEYNMMQIGQILKRNKTPIYINDNEIYKRVTIKTKNGGIFLRDNISGENIGTKKQFIIKSGQFLLSKIDARNGAFGVVPKEVDGAIITGNFWAYDVDDKIIEPHFLSLLTTTKEFINYCNTCSRGTTGRHYLQEDLFLSTPIPIPSLSTQKRLVNEYNEKIKKAETLNKSAIKDRKKIDDVIFKVLGVRIHNKSKKSKGLSFVNYKNINRWGVEILLNNLELDKMLLSNKYKCIRLSEVVDINPMTSFDNVKDDDIISYMPMECISDYSGEIIMQYKGYKNKAKGYTKFKEGDLLWAKITPCMENGKSAIAKGLYNGYGYGSTEYHVIRKKDISINIRYIYYILRTKFVREQAKVYFTGSAGQQRVPDSFLKDLVIPIPELKYQDKIVKVLDKLKKRSIDKSNDSIKHRKLAIDNFEKKLF